MLDRTWRPRKGDIIERTHSPGERCLVTGRVGDFVEFTVIGSSKIRLVAERACRLIEPLNASDE